MEQALTSQTRQEPEKKVRRAFTQLRGLFTELTNQLQPAACRKKTLKYTHSYLLADIAKQLGVLYQNEDVEEGLRSTMRRLAMFVDILKEHIAGEALPTKARCREIAERHLQSEDLHFDEAAAARQEQEHHAWVQQRLQHHQAYKQAFQPTQFRSAEVIQPAHVLKQEKSITCPLLPGT